MNANDHSERPGHCTACAARMAELEQRIRALENAVLLLQTPDPDGPAPADDPVEHPSHYCLGGVEVIDAIEAWGLNYHAGNAVKYIARAGRKNPAKLVEDLRKAAWYLDRLIKRLEAGK